MEGFEGEGVGFYRCAICRTVNAPWDLKKHGGCHSCGGTKVFATNPTLWEKFIQILRRPAVWRWDESV